MNYRFGYAFDVAGTKSFRLSSRALFGDIGCLYPTTEVLTKTGWIRFKDLLDGTLIAAWRDTDRAIGWEPAHIVKYPTNTFGYMYEASTYCHRTGYTPNHRIAHKHRTSSKFYQVSTPAQLAGKSNIVLPLSGICNEAYIQLTSAEARLLAMTQADASIEGEWFRITFMKARKNARFGQIMKELGLPFKIHKGDLGYWRYAYQYDFRGLLDSTKTFSWQLLGAPLESRIAFLDEVAQWDGHIRNRSFVYCTVNTINANIVSTIAHISGRSATISTEFNNSRGYGSADNQPLHKVNVKPRDYHYFDCRQFTYTEYTGPVYCLHTSTGFFLCRHEGAIHVTGNSNVQNMPEEMRSFMVPDSGKTLIQVDQSGAEALIVAYLTEAANYRALFKLGIKPHTYIALNIFTDKFRGKYQRDRYQFRTPYELVELPEWPALNKFISKDESNVIEYQLGKKTAHAKAYNMGPLTFQKQVLLESEGRIHLSFQEAKTFLQTYEKLFPEVIEWQAHLLDEVRSNRMLYNLFGFPRRFDGRWNNDLEREALSYIPQSTVGCLTSMTFTDLFWYAINNNLAWDILVNVHDAVVAQVPIGEEVQAIHKTQELFGRELVSPRGEKFHMKSEGMVGSTWRKHDMTEVK